MSFYPTNTSINAIADIFTEGTPYLALFTSSPNASGGGTEVSGGSYERKEITFGSVSGGAVSNTVAITFAGLLQANITHWAVMSAETGVTMRGYGALNNTAATVGGDQIDFDVATVKITIAGS